MHRYHFLEKGNIFKGILIRVMQTPHRSLDLQPSEVAALLEDEESRATFLRRLGSSMGILDEGHDHDDATYDLEEEAKTDECVAKRTIPIFDPRVQSTVLTTWKCLLRTIVAMLFGFVIILSLFYGLAWNTKSNYNNIQMAVCDLDRGPIGATIIALATNQSIVPFTVTVLTGLTSLDDVKSLVDGGSFNAALVANPSASDNLLAAIRNRTAAYSAAAATSFIFDEGRGGSQMASILRLNIPPVASVLASGQLSAALYRNLTGPAVGATLSSLNAAALVSPVGNTEVNLHRIQYTGQNSLIGLGAPRPRPRRPPGRPPRPSSFLPSALRMPPSATAAGSPAVAARGRERAVRRPPSAARTREPQPSLQSHPHAAD